MILKLMKKKLFDQSRSSNFQSSSSDLISAFCLHNYQEAKLNHKDNLQMQTSKSL